MNYNEYKKLFSETAIKKGKDSEYIRLCLSYAQKLYAKNVPVIYDIKHFSLLVGVKDDYIKRAITYTQKYYWYFEIAKLDGGKRPISEPLPTLKNIQLWILNNILEKQPVHPFAKAYVPLKKLKENAKYHTRQKIVIALDVHNFFPSIELEQIVQIFFKIGYAKKISFLLAKLCCLNNCLPQGAPTSPYISNLYMYYFDEKVMNYCREKGIIYTRYADDLTFSSKENIDIHYLIEFVKDELRQKNLSLNTRKTRIMHEYDSQIVTGVLVNKRMRLPRIKRYELRQEMYYVITRGVESHLKFKDCTKQNYLRHLAGKVMYALYLEPSNSEFIDYRLYLQKLIDPNFKLRKKRLALDSNSILQEQEINKLPASYIELIHNDKSEYIFGNIHHLYYKPSASHVNSFIFANYLTKISAKNDVKIVEGIVVMTDGVAYECFWNHIIQDDGDYYYDVTLDSFDKPISQAKIRRYYIVSEYSIEEMIKRLCIKGVYSEKVKMDLRLYYETHAIQYEKYKKMKAKLGLSEL